MNRGIIDNLNKSIEALEKTAGKDIHSEKWKRCVEHVKGQGDADNAYAVCTASLGEDSFKSFSKSDDLTPDDMAKINTALLEKASERLMDMEKSLADFNGDAVDFSMAEPVTGNGPAGMLSTPTLDILYGNSPLPRPFILGDPEPFGKGGR